MHYANGKEAKVGDKVVGKNANGNPIGGTVIEAIPGCDTCNLNVVLEGALVHIATASECLLVEDIPKAE